MEKKTIYYILGGVAVLGIGYYLWSNSQKKAKETEEKTDDNATKDVEADATTTDKSAIETPTTPATATSGKSATATSGKSATASGIASKPAPKKLTAQELEAKLQSGCGKKPKLKKNKIKYDQCRANLTAKLKSQGLVAFDGSYGFEGLSEMYEQNIIREKSFAEQVINREDGRMFAGSVYEN
jgi:hypothetical protein